LAVIWETTDRLGRLVVLTTEHWEHVVAEHNELAGYEEEVRLAVAYADEVRRDREFAHRDVHYRHTGIGSLWLRVVVHYRPAEPSGWAGEVITSFLTSRQSQREVLRWP
jgi:hypothetical protein